MPIQDLTKIYEGADLSGATSLVVYLPVVRAGTLSKIDVFTDAVQTGVAVFELTRNGAAIQNIANTAPLQVVIAAGSKIGSASGLTHPLAVGDEIVLNLISGNVSAPLTLNLSVSDGIPDYQESFALSDESTAITDGVKITFHVISAFNLTDIFAGLKTASSASVVTVIVKKNGADIFGANKLSIDVAETTSLTAAAPVNISTAAFARGDQVTVEVTAAGTGAIGLKIYFRGTKV